MHQPPSGDIDYAIMTVVRPKDYIHNLLNSVRPDLSLRVVVGSPNHNYLDKFRQNPFIEIIEAGNREWTKYKDSEIRHRASWNYWRCLTLGPKNPSRRGFLIFEDDVIPAFGWEQRLHETINEISNEFGERYVLTLYSSLRLAVDESRRTKYTLYPTDLFTCTQAVYYPENVRAGFSRFLRRYGVNTFHVPYDLLLRVFLLKRGIPLFATTPSLVQHYGEISTGLGDFHQSPDFQTSV